MAVKKRKKSGFVEVTSSHKPEASVRIISEPTPEAFAEFGVAGEGIFGGYDTHEMLNLQRVSIDQLDTMLEIDGQAAALYNLITLPIRFSTKNLHIRSSGERGKSEAKFVEEVLLRPVQLGGMKTPYRDIITQMCVAFKHGFRAFEKVFKIDENDDIVYDKIAWRSPKNLFIRVNDFGEFDGLAQRTNYINRFVDVKLDKEYSAVFTVGGEHNAFYGKSAFLPAYYHFDKKHKMYYIAHLAHQFNAIPGRIGIAPPNSTEDKRRAFLAKLADFGLNTALVMPDGYDIKQFPESIRSIAPYIELINHHDVMMAKVFLAHFSELGMAANSGSWALSKNNFDLFMISMQTFLDQFAEWWNVWIIPQLIDWNFGTRNYPQVYFKAIDENQKLFLKEIFYKISIDEAPNVSSEFLYKMEAMISDELNMGLVYKDMEDTEVKFDKEAYPRISEASKAQTAASEAAAATGISGGNQGAARNKPATTNRGGSTQPANQAAPR